jgi:hypothetical protein
MAALLKPEEVDSYIDAVDWLLTVVGSGEVAGAWETPSALARYSTGGLAAHALQAGVLRLLDVLAEPAPADRRLVTVPEFYGPAKVTDPSDDDPLFVVLRAMAEELAADGPLPLLESGRRARQSLVALLPTVEAGRAVAVARIPEGRVTLRAYLATRVLELVVHGDDVVASIPDWEAPPPPPAAVEVALGVCMELARAQAGDLAALRAFTRQERARPDLLRVL